MLTNAIAFRYIIWLKASAVRQRHAYGFEIPAALHGTAFATVYRNKVGIDIQLHHCLADGNELALATDAKLETNGLAVMRLARLLDHQTARVAWRTRCDTAARVQLLLPGLPNVWLQSPAYSSCPGKIPP